MIVLILLISTVIATALLTEFLYWFFEYYTSYDTFSEETKRHSVSKVVYNITAEQAIKAIEKLIDTGEATYHPSIGCILNRNRYGRDINISEYGFEINWNHYTFSFWEYCKYKKYFDEKLPNNLTEIIDLRDKDIL